MKQNKIHSQIFDGKTKHDNGTHLKMSEFRNVCPDHQKSEKHSSPLQDYPESFQNGFSSKQRI